MKKILSNTFWLHDEKNNTILKYILYCLSRKNHTNNIDLKNITVKNKVLRQKVKIIVCLFDKLK